MNYWILVLTFLSVNLDFFFMLIFLLKKFQFKQVMMGYLLGNLVIVSASYFIGRGLAMFIPEWILGILGILPIYLAFRDESDDDGVKSNKSPILTVFVTYLSVCAGCNLSIFLPILISEDFATFVTSLIIICALTIMVVFLIKKIADNRIVSRLMEQYGETLMKICYVVIGLYVFWDSGLITHLIDLFRS